MGVVQTWLQCSKCNNTQWLQQFSTMWGLVWLCTLIIFFFFQWSSSSAALLYILVLNRWMDCERESICIFKAAQRRLFFILKFNFHLKVYLINFRMCCWGFLVSSPYYLKKNKNKTTNSQNNFGFLSCLLYQLCITLRHYFTYQPWWRQLTRHVWDPARERTVL